MGLLGRLFGKRGGKDEAEIISALESLNAGEEEKEERIEDLKILEEQWLRKRSEETTKYEEEEKEEGKEKKDEDELIESLKKEDKKEVEMNFALNKEIEEMGDVNVREILELGREILDDMRRMD